MDVKLQFQYELTKGKFVTVETDWFAIEYAKQALFRAGERFDRNTLQLIEETGMTWTYKEFLAQSQQKDVVQQFSIWTDGSFSPMNYEGAYGFEVEWVTSTSVHRHRQSAHIGRVQTSSEAEYIAIYEAFRWMQLEGIRGVAGTVHSDAKGAMLQLKGDYPCYDVKLCDWLDRIEELVQQQALRPVWKVISRADNDSAHRLAKRALEGQDIYATIELENE